MAVNDGTNLGAFVPVILFLFAQTGMAIWFISGLDNRIVALRTDVDELREAVITEQRIQRDRTSQLESDLATLAGMERTFAVKFSSLQDSIRLLRDEIRTQHEHNNNNGWGTP